MDEMKKIEKIRNNNINYLLSINNNTIDGKSIILFILRQTYWNKL
jgi:hypothetical protein